MPTDPDSIDPEDQVVGPADSTFWATRPDDLENEAYVQAMLHEQWDLDKQNIETPSDPTESDNA